MSSPDQSPQEGLERAAVGRVMRHIMPLFCLMYLVAYIDRQNVSYAKLEMVGALGLSEAAYGLGASLFFLGYFLFEAPSNLILTRVGARLWFPRIMLTWGLVTVALGFTQNAAMFYVLRFLLGVAEAGFFPGVIYVLTLWFPAASRTRALGVFMITSAAGNAVGSLIGGALLDLDGLAGLAGWQWVFIATGVPAVLLAPYVFFNLPSRPEDARFLPSDEKACLLRMLAADPKPEAEGSPWRALLDRRVLTLAALYVGIPLGTYGLSYWLPTIVKGFGASSLQNGLVNLLLWIIVGLALWWFPRFAARRGVNRWHIGAPLILGAVALLGSVLIQDNGAKFALLCVAAAAIFACQPVFWTAPQRVLWGPHAAAGIAAVNSVGNLGGFVAQNTIPAIRDATGSVMTPMFFLAGCLAAAGVGMLLFLPSEATESGR